MRNCDGDILLLLPWVHTIGRRIFICNDFVFSGGCNDSCLDFTAELVSANVIEITMNGSGWYSTEYEGKQYMFPSIEYKEAIVDACSMLDLHYLLQDSIPESVEETPVKLVLCRVTRVSHVTGSYYNTDCNYIMYMRRCNGTLQFDTISTDLVKLCLVLPSSVTVIPEIGHTTQYVDVDGNSAMMFIPFVQYRCSFEMDIGALYKIIWYINDTLVAEMEPTYSSDDLAVRYNVTNDVELGYMIKCGVVKMPMEESSELLSFNFFAGWKVSDKGIELTKGGYVNVDVELTVPIGCTYTVNEQARCIKELLITDPSYIPDVCKGGILAINADDPSKDSHELQTLQQATEWTGNKKYRFKLSTSDVNYDDGTVYDLEVRVTDGAGIRTRRDVESHTKVIDILHVQVKDAWRHLNKLCYSHVDPHMRTADGSYYEQQREGDYLLLRNTAHQMEIQESERYCSPPPHSKHPPPVCTCGIVIRFGADVFMINRCGRLNFLDFVQCGDGGILEVDRIHDYRYRVRTPTGTIIDITIHGRGKTMNIDVYMSPRDFANIVGLCGYFDDKVANDFLHRDGNYSDENTNYTFSDSWRLSDEENLFKNLNRSLQPLNNNKEYRTCGRTTSITKQKCKEGRRSRRGVSDVRRDFERLYPLMSTQEPIRLKRNAPNTMTVDEVTSLCNASIFGSPAVVEMQDKLVDEDLSEVVTQCVYDVTEGNDTVWVEAHVQALSNIVTTVLELNPVYVANNSEIVKNFLSQTCLNNCSGNGVCSDTGYCVCNDPYRGPDCGIDLKIPPIIYDIEGGGICAVTTGSDCECFVIRTDNIFDGFLCNINTYMVFFNGTRSQVGHIQQAGEYEDIFTGICCVTGEVTKLPENIKDHFVDIYELSISNDGVNYGETTPVYIYDTTCIRHVVKNDSTALEIKNGNCFIDGTCYKHGSTEQGDHCSVCHSHMDPYRWYKGNCDESDTKFRSAALTGAIICSLLGFSFLAILTFLILCKVISKHRAVHDVHSPVQTSPLHLDLREPYNIKYKGRSD